MTRCDIVLFRGHAFSDWWIRLGQSIRYGRKSGYFRFTHCGLVVTTQGDTIEATSSGVHCHTLAGRTDYVVIHVDGSEEDKQHAIAFAQSCLTKHDTYSWFTIFGIGLSLLTNCHFTFGVRDEVICSGLCASALERLGVIWPDDASGMSPADIVAFYRV